MATEDLTTWLEADPNGRLTVISSKVTAASYQAADTGTRVSIDIGTNQINALDIDFTVYWSSVSGDAPGPAVFSVVADLNDYYTSAGADDINIVLYKRTVSPSYLLSMRRGTGDWGADEDSYGMSLFTAYYCTLSRSAGSSTINLYIYSNSARTVLVDTLSISLASASTKYRYFAICNSSGASDSDSFGYYVETVDLNGYAPVVVGGAAPIMW